MYYEKLADKYHILQYVAGFLTVIFAAGAIFWGVRSMNGDSFRYLWKTLSINPVSLDAAYDESSLKEQALQSVVQFDVALSQAELKMSRMTDLHECAKATFDIWQNKGLFARKKAIRILRQKAGFRLETKRIGNYVAKTFDLMNEARAEYARAQQTLFASDMSYKIKPGIYLEIRKRLSSLLSENHPLA